MRIRIHYVRKICGFAEHICGYMRESIGIPSYANDFAASNVNTCLYFVHVLTMLVHVAVLEVNSCHRKILFSQADAHTKSGSLFHIRTGPK